jgi:A/G-specific adenine glycosylase
MPTGNEIYYTNSYKVRLIVNTKDIMLFRRTLKDWGIENYRPFPWRKSGEPYKILLAELMLHRTQASQVTKVYEKVLERYPNIQSLANATNVELNDILYPLGLQWRINLIGEMAGIIMKRFGAEIPQDKADLLSLPGVSEYIASSVRCFAWNIAEPVIDTNTVRVTGRLFNIEVKDSSRRNSNFRRLASQLVDPVEPKIYNYALLDLADQVCTKRQDPKCRQCPVAGFCLYYRDRQKEFNMTKAVKVS